MKYLILIHLLIGFLSANGQELNLKGTWQPQLYTLKNGEEIKVDGQIFFSESKWQVLFFVLDDQMDPIRASAEGGDFTINSDTLTFYHQYHYSGNKNELPQGFRVLNSETKEKEVCSMKLTTDHLTIYFPSGNKMTFSKISN